MLSTTSSPTLPNLTGQNKTKKQNKTKFICKLCISSLASTIHSNTTYKHIHCIQHTHYRVGTRNQSRS